MKTFAELKQMSFIPHHDCGVCGATVGWEVAPNTPNPYFNPSCDCGCSDGHYETWENAFKWYNVVFEKESEKDVLEAWEKELVKIVPVKSGEYATDFNKIIKSELGELRGDVLQKLNFLKDRIQDCATNQQLDFIRFRLESMESNLHGLLREKAFLEMIENHKSNWVPDSKGGEPNCRREK